MARAQAARGLVEHEHPGTLGEAGGHGQALALAAGKGQGMALGAGGEAESGQHRVGGLVAFPMQLGAGAVGEQLVARLLHDQMHEARAPSGGHGRPVHGHGARALAGKPRQAAQERGLAGAVAADDAEHAPGLQGEVEAVQYRRPAAEGHGQAGGLQPGRFGRGGIG